MTSRVMLLMMATGLFIAVWTTDHRDNSKSQFVAAPARFAPHMPVTQTVAVSGFPFGEDAGHPNECSQQQPAIAAATVSTESAGSLCSLDEIPMDNLWMFGGTNLCLPNGIAPGNYRVVDSHGGVRSISLSNEDLAYFNVSSESPRQDLYTLTEEGVRVYFIRIDEPSPRTSIGVTKSTGQGWWPNACRSIRALATSAIEDVAMAATIEQQPATEVFLTSPVALQSRLHSERNSVFFARKPAASGN